MHPQNFLTEENHNNPDKLLLRQKHDNINAANFIPSPKRRSSAKKYNTIRILL